MRWPLDRGGIAPGAAAPSEFVGNGHAMSIHPYVSLWDLPLSPCWTVGARTRRNTSCTQRASPNSSVGVVFFGTVQARSVDEQTQQRWFAFYMAAIVDAHARTVTPRCRPQSYRSRVAPTTARQTQRTTCQPAIDVPLADRNKTCLPHPTASRSKPLCASRRARRDVARWRWTLTTNRYFASTARYGAHDEAQRHCQSSGWRRCRAHDWEGGCHVCVLGGGALRALTLQPPCADPAVRAIKLVPPACFTWFAFAIIPIRRRSGATRFGTRAVLLS